MDGVDHLHALEAVGGIRSGGTIVADRGAFPVPEGIDRVTVDMVAALEYGWALCGADVADPKGSWPTHDPIRLGRVLADFTRQ